MIGDGSLLETVKKYSEYHQINNINYLGRLDNVHVLDELSKCSLLLMTSKKEGLPKVVLEAATQGVPTIYINKYYKIDYIIDGINGYGVLNTDSMINTIKELYSNPTLYSRLSKEVRHLANKYNWELLIKKYETYFIECLNHSKKK